MIINATGEFEVWASSLAGCDGGNPAGAIWFCGIEWGGGDDVETFKFDINISPVWDDERLKNFTKYQYDRKVAKIYSVLIGKEIGEYQEVAFEKRIFSGESDLFKLNLYPISFHHDSDELWDRRWYEKTGLPTKSIYRAWCQINRFKKFQELVEKHNPRLIVATSTSYKTDFIMAFAGADTIYHSDIKSEVINNKYLEWLNINNDKTILAITPFLGTRYGLNSDAQLRGFANKLLTICSEKFGIDWIKKTR